MKVKSFHLLNKKLTNLSQFFWLNDSVVTGWLVWGVTVWDMLSFFCVEILLSEVFSNFFIAKSKNEFPADIEVLLSLTVRNFIVLNDLPSLPVCVQKCLLIACLGQRNTWILRVHVSAVLLAKLPMLFDICIFLHVSFHPENCPVSFLHSSDTKSFVYWFPLSLTVYQFNLFQKHCL